MLCSLNWKGKKSMLAKHWKKIGLLILIIACLCNLMSKMVNKMSLDKELLTSANYMNEQNNKKENNY